MKKNVIVGVAGMVFVVLVAAFAFWGGLFSQFNAPPSGNSTLTKTLSIGGSIPNQLPDLRLFA